MPNIYLHHYPASPFSEKIRALLGVLDLEWYSVETSIIMPRPLLMPLSGGYRRIPVAQIGADVYCVTPTDVARVPVEGELVRADAQEFALRRTTEETGAVVTHFPRTGFALES